MPFSSKVNKTNNTKLRKFAKKIQCINFLGGACKHCGTTDIHVLEFHHKNPIEKDRTISDLMTYSWENIRNELEKCILLCGNCHVREHTDIKFYEDNKNKIHQLATDGMWIEKKINDEELVVLVKNGWSQRGIARKYNMAKTTVQFRIRQLIDKGLVAENETKTMKGFDPNRRAVEKVTLEMILPMLNSGDSILSISKHFDVNFSTIQRKARKLRQSGKWIPTVDQLRYLSK